MMKSASIVKGISKPTDASTLQTVTHTAWLFRRTAKDD